MSVAQLTQFQVDALKEVLALLEHAKELRRRGGGVDVLLAEKEARVMLHAVLAALKS